jgi:hypothetical protein
MANVEQLRRELDACIAEVIAAAHVAGVNPAEVRTALLDLQTRFEWRVDEIEDDDDAIWEFRHRRLDRFVGEELEKYIRTVAPRPSVGGVFARAASQASAGGSPDPTAATTVHLHRCKTCGAARLPGALYGNCTYGGKPFFEGT